MTHRLRAFSGACLVAAGLLFASQAALGETEASVFGRLEPVRVHGTIVDIAVSNPNFSTLVSALAATNLVTTLQGTGPFTVFAPTNSAFEKIPAPILDYLVSNPSVLKQVLLYHVASGIRNLEFAFLPQVVGTVQGERVFARVVFHGETAVLQINNSSVTLRPIRADNGLIYVIDSVLQPQFR